MQIESTEAIWSAPADAGEVVDRLAGLRHGVQELLGVGAQRAPRGREREAVLAALEELHGERVLERPDARADRRLGQAERVGRPAEAAEGADRQERLDLRDFH